MDVIIFCVKLKGTGRNDILASDTNGGSIYWNPIVGLRMSFDWTFVVG